MTIHDLLAPPPTGTPRQAATLFDYPPHDPLVGVRAWFDDADTDGVREPGAVAFATADAQGRPSNRTVKVLYVTAEGVVFTSHLGSQKGREIAATGHGSIVAYWRENNRQIVLSGPVATTPDAISDRLWAERPSGTHAMSVASQQSLPLADEPALRARAHALAGCAEALHRPPGWVGYLLSPTAIEFWAVGTERLHERLRYDATAHGWSHVRLQP